MKVVRGLICWLVGHNEKRVPLAAHLVDGCEEQQYNRICKRCGATRLARKRKPKAA